MSSGGSVAPGTAAAAGTLNFAQPLTVPVGATLAARITGAATSDKVAVTGSLTAAGTIAVTLSGYVPVLNDVFDLADASGITGTPTFDFSAAVLTAGLAWDTGSFATDGTIKVVVDDPFIAWAAGYGLAGGDADKAADPDKDGIPNLLEFATNSNPTSGSSGPRVYGKLHLIGADNVMTLTAAVRSGATFAATGTTQESTKDKLKYTVEATSDLSDWTGETVSELGPVDAAAVQAALSLPTLDSGWEWHSFRTGGAAASDARDFVRLEVIEAP